MNGFLRYLQTSIRRFNALIQRKGESILFLSYPIKKWFVVKISHTPHTHRVNLAGLKDKS